MQIQLESLRELAKQSQINYTVVKDAVGFMNSESQDNLWLRIGNWELGIHEFQIPENPTQFKNQFHE